MADFHGSVADFHRRDPHPLADLDGRFLRGMTNLYRGFLGGVADLDRD